MGVAVDGGAPGLSVRNGRAVLTGAEAERLLLDWFDASVDAGGPDEGSVPPEAVADFVPFLSNSGRFHVTDLVTRLGVEGFGDVTDAIRHAGNPRKWPSRYRTPVSWAGFIGRPDPAPPRPNGEVAASRTPLPIAEGLEGYVPDSYRPRRSGVTRFAVSGDDAEKLMLGCFDYSLGRMTYMVGVSIELLSDFLAFLSNEGRYHVVDAIDHAVANGQAGMDFDARSWRRLAEVIRHAPNPKRHPSFLTLRKPTGIDDFWCMVCTCHRYDLGCAGEGHAARFTPDDYTRIIGGDVAVLNDKWRTNLMRDVEDERDMYERFDKHDWPGAYAADVDGWNRHYRWLGGLAIDGRTVDPRYLRFWGVEPLPRGARSDS